MQAWELFLTHLEPKLGKEVLNTWARTLRVVSFDARNLYLHAQDPFQIAWFEEHLKPRLTEFVTSSGRPIRVHLSLQGSAPPLASTRSLFPIPELIVPSPLDPELSLNTFIPQDRMIESLFYKPSLTLGAFNPLVIYGESQTGKTHLLQATAQAFLQNNKQVFFVRTETLTEHVVQAIRSNRMAEFRNTYRKVDLLIVDDIHCLARKAATQEEFFHTFNALHTAGKQMLFSSAVPPSQLEEIEPRLVSRFEWGLSVEMKKMNAKSVIEAKAALWKLPLSEELICYLSETFQTHPVPVLETLRLRLPTHPPSPITLKMASTLLHDILAKAKELALTPQKIIQEVSAHYGIRGEDLLSKSHTQEFVLPRQTAIYLCREKLRLPLQSIGKIFGRDHSTVLSSLKELIKKMEKKREVEISVQEISKRLMLKS